MMIGVTCTCAPSLSKMVHEKSPHIEVLTSHIRSHLPHLPIWPNFLRGFSPKSSFAYEQRLKSKSNFAADPSSGKERLTRKRTTDTIDQDSYELSPNKGPIHTFVDGGQPHHEEPFIYGGNRIHLRREVFQKRETAVDGYRFA